MTLQQMVEQEIAALQTPMRIHVLMHVLGDDAPAVSVRAEEMVQSASTIKVLVLVAALAKIQAGGCTLQTKLTVLKEQILPDTQVMLQGEKTYSLQELLTWMIVLSDNTATNVLIDFIGMTAINAIAEQLHLDSTRLRRKMLDFAAAQQGFDNTTSARDLCTIFMALYEKTILTAPLCHTARRILKQQRDQTVLLRYVWQDVFVAHKTGELDDLRHDAGVFETARPYFLAVLITHTDNITKAEELAGRISKQIYLAEEEKQCKLSYRPI